MGCVGVGHLSTNIKYLLITKLLSNLLLRIGGRRRGVRDVSHGYKSEVVITLNSYVDPGNVSETGCALCFSH